jgi:hypothetical protein
MHPLVTMQSKKSKAKVEVLKGHDGMRMNGEGRKGLRWVRKGDSVGCCHHIDAGHSP